MANKNAVKTGNWSDPTVWNGGTLPTSSDDVFANTFTVTIDQNITVLSLRTTSGSGITAGGVFTVASGSPAINVTSGILAATHNGVNASYILTLTGGSPTITANVTGGSTTGRHSINATGGTPTIIGTVTGGVLTATYGVVLNGATLAVTGNVNGSAGAGVLVNDTAGVLNVTGDVNGGTASSGTPWGVYFLAAGTVNVTGTVSGGSGSVGYGINVLAAGILNLAGVTGGAGASTAYGLSVTAAATIACTGTVLASAAPAINNTSTASITLSGRVEASSTQPAVVNTNTTNAVKCSGTIAHAANGNAPLQGCFLGTSTTVYEMRDSTNFPATSPAGTAESLSLAGTNNPATGDVRSGTHYGAGGVLTGTLAVPPAASVASGVPVDAGTGTAVLTAAALAAITGNQIAAVFP